MNTLRHNPHLYMLTIVAIILSFMASISPLWAKSGHIIEVCSTFDTRQISVDENGNEIPPAPKLKKSCTLCLVTLIDVLPAPNFNISDHLNAITTQTTLWHEITQTPKTHASENYSARAPPVFS